MKHLRLTLGLATAALLCSCEEKETAAIEQCINDTIAQGRRATWVQGTWVITGIGERSHCSDEALNTDEFKLRSRAFRVHQQGHLLFLESHGAAGLSLGGRVGDRCIRVRAVERHNGQSISYDFPGRFVGTSAFTGKFTSHGPGNCESEGTFEVHVALDSIPSDPGDNPAPDDAGAPDLCQSCLEGCEQIEPEVPDCTRHCQQSVCSDGGMGDDDAGDQDGAEPDAGEQDARPLPVRDAEPLNLCRACHQECNELEPEVPGCTWFCRQSVCGAEDLDAGGQDASEPDAGNEQDAGPVLERDAEPLDLCQSCYQSCRQLEPAFPNCTWYCRQSVCDEVPDAGTQDAVADGEMPDAPEEDAAEDASSESDGEPADGPEVDSPGTDAGGSGADASNPNEPEYVLWDGDGEEDQSLSADTEAVCAVGSVGAKRALGGTAIAALLGLLAAAGRKRQRLRRNK